MVCAQGFIVGADAHIGPHPGRILSLPQLNGEMLFIIPFPAPFNVPVGSVRFAGRCGHRPLHSRRIAYHSTYPSWLPPGGSWQPEGLTDEGRRPVKCGTSRMNGTRCRFHCRGRCPHRPAPGGVNIRDPVEWGNVTFLSRSPVPFNVPRDSVRFAGRCGHRPLHSRRTVYRSTYHLSRFRGSLGNKPHKTLCLCKHRYL